MAYEPTRHDRPNLGRYGNNNSPNNTGVPNNNAFNNAGNLNGFGGFGQNGGEQIRDILHVIFKRKRLIGILFLAVALPGIMATALQKPSYLASAMVMISTLRSEPALQPTDLTRLDQIKLNESLVNSEVYVIKSRDLLEMVVRRLAQADDGTIRVGEQSFGRQVQAIGGRLGVTPVKGSNVIRIDYRSGSEEYAARVVNRVVDEYLTYNAQVHGASTKVLPQFYEDQRRDLAKELREAEQALLEFTYQTGLVSPVEEVGYAVRSQNEIRAVLREVGMNIAGTEESIEAMREQIGEQPELVKQSQSLEVNPVIKQLSTHLLERRVDRVSLLRRYMEEDRLIRDNAEEIEELRGQLQEEVSQRPTIVANELIRINPLREALLRELLERESSLRGLRARQATLEEEERELGGRLIQLRKDTMEYERLQQEATHRKQTYELYLKRAQEARISKAMDERKLVNVDVVQRPALPLPRADTQRVTLMLSLIAGMLVGVAGAFGREYMTRSLRTEHDVQRHLGLPLLASIGEIPQK